MKVICAPQKVGVGLRPNLRTIRRMLPRVVGLTEMDLGKTSETHLIRRVFGRLYRVLARDIGAHSEEIPVAIRRGPFCKILHFHLLSISPDVGIKGTGNDRYLAIVWFRLFRKTYAVMHTHVDAVIQNHNPDSPHYGEMLDNERVAATAKAMQIIETTAETILDDKSVDALIVMGDLNILPIGDGMHCRAWEHSPQSMFSRLGMEWRNSRVVYLAWSKGLKLRGEVQTIAAESAHNLADHGWLVGRLVRR